MTEQRSTPQHGVTQDMPLPGLYPCLTIQLNVTRYAEQKRGRYVLVVREPSAQLEVSRSFLDIGDWETVAAAASDALAQALVNLRWLQEGTLNT